MGARRFIELAKHRLFTTSAGHPASRPGWAALSIVVLWLVATAYAFWWFALRDIKPFEASTSPRIGMFDASQRTLAAEVWFKSAIAGSNSQTTVATVIHITQPSCSCNRFNKPHFTSIVEKYASKGIAFRAFAHPAAPPLSADVIEIKKATLRGALDWVTSTPAALVFDAGGHLIYFGPYSFGAMCGTVGGPVEEVLDSVLAKQSVAPPPTQAVGCYCTQDRFT